MTDSALTELLAEPLAVPRANSLVQAPTPCLAQSIAGCISEQGVLEATFPKICKVAKSAAL
jgi:hypothetical protein